MALQIGDNPNTGHLIQGNLIGTNAAGAAALNPDAIFGVSLRTVTGCVVGGNTAAARNVISGLIGGVLFGVSSGGLSATGNFVQGNFIGTDVTGTHVIGANESYGIGAFNQNNTVGGSNPGEGNLIAGTGMGIYINGGSGTVVKGNLIGTDSTGTVDLGNDVNGISISADNVTIGGTLPGWGNIIAFNGKRPTQSAGVAVYGQHDAIRGNRIYGTQASGLGIDLVSGELGVTPNDAGDGDTGPNGLQNFPIITGFTYGATTTTVQGTLNSAASTNYQLDFFADPACSLRPQDFLEGTTYLGTIQVTTDGAGNGTFNQAFPTAVAAGSGITATATSPLGDTSEFSQRIVLSTNFREGPPEGGTAITLTGMLFQDPATVLVGGVPATGVSVVNPTTINATVPALSPGTVNPITVMTGGLTGTLVNAWVADFTDVPSSNPISPYVDKLVANAITAGCGSGNYCPQAPVTRAQMAVLLLRAGRGLCYAPPPATGTVFTDVPLGSFAAAFIEALAAAQVTSGCGGSNYCPSSPVTRAQMAVFLLRTLEGPTYLPPACTTATFSDVPCSSGFSPWIYELVHRGVTAGCGGGMYCPNSSVTRGQMAVFLSVTFSLP